MDLELLQDIVGGIVAIIGAVGIALIMAGLGA